MDISIRIATESIRLHVPHHKQEKAISCGAAAVRCLAEYYDFGPSSEASWRKILNTDENGTAPRHIARSLRHFGLKVLVRKNLEIGEILDALDHNWPIICPIQAWGSYYHYRNINSGHYVVAIGYDNRNLYFLDPSLKRARGWMTQYKFFKRWHDTDDKGTYYNQSGLIVKCPWEPVREYRLFTAWEIA